MTRRQNTMFRHHRQQLNPVTVISGNNRSLFSLAGETLSCEISTLEANGLILRDMIVIVARDGSFKEFRRCATIEDEEGDTLMWKFATLDDSLPVKGITIFND